LGFGGLALAVLSTVLMSFCDPPSLGVWLKIVVPLHCAIVLTLLYELVLVVVQRRALHGILARAALFGFNAAFALAEMLVLLALVQR
jgi:chromate transport protein ChrA